MKRRTGLTWRGIQRGDPCKLLSHQNVAVPFLHSYHWYDVCMIASKQRTIDSIRLAEDSFANVKKRETNFSITWRWIMYKGRRQWCVWIRFSSWSLNQLKDWLHHIILSLKDSVTWQILSQNSSVGLFLNMYYVSSNEVISSRPLKKVAWHILSQSRCKSYLVHDYLFQTNTI